MCIMIQKELRRKNSEIAFTYEMHCIEITFCACSKDVYDIFVFSDVDKQF